MLVNREQEWASLPPQEQTEENVITTPHSNTGLKRKCLQLIFLLTAAAMIVTVQTQSMVRAGYELVDLKVQAANLEKENELLRLDIAKLKSPERIERIATQELGMVVPENTYYVTASKPAANTPTSTATAQAISIINKAEASKAH